jgi:hypothetical protein
MAHPPSTKAMADRERKTYHESTKSLKHPPSLIRPDGQAKAGQAKENNFFGRR